MTKTKPMTQFAVWTTEQVDAEASYWMLYDTLEDAVSDNGDGTEVYKFEATLVGTFRRAVKIERVRQLKRKRQTKRKRAA